MSLREGGKSADISSNSNTKDKNKEIKVMLFSSKASKCVNNFILFFVVCEIKCQSGWWVGILILLMNI